MQLEIIGSSPAWPNPGGACSGYLVDNRLLLDCGPGVLAKLRERPGTNGWPDVEAIAITHLHLDHWGDLVPWVWGSLFGPGASQEKPKLRLPPGARATLGPILAQLGGDDMFDRAFDVDEYEAGTPFELAGLTLTALPVVHYSMPAFGFRVDGDRTLAYSGDTGPCSELVELARDADLFLCEATLDNPKPEAALRGHLSAEEARAASSDAGARRLVLTHRPDEREPPAGAELAHDGLELTF
ncbi:MAG: MBL fold metallo-hydrolase [Actinobacteria bacterium]|nr:MBL fold metallo-hydrolase [Actinomycetota bacterium]